MRKRRMNSSMASVITFGPVMSAGAGSGASQRPRYPANWQSLETLGFPCRPNLVFWLCPLMRIRGAFRNVGVAFGVLDSRILDR
jgi:hypothetical protein